MKVPESDQFDAVNGLLSSLSHEIAAVLRFKGKWSIILAKLLHLQSRLPALSDSASFPSNPLSDELLRSVAGTLDDAGALAKRCQSGSPCQGKLRMQSDVDSVSAKLDALIGDAEVLIRSGVLRDTREPTGSRRGAVRAESRNVVTRLQIGSRESKNAAMDSLLVLLQSDDKNSLIAVAEGVVPVLVRLLDSSCGEMKEKAVTAIARISTVENCKHALMTEGLFLLNHLLRALESGSGVAKEKACVSLRALTFSKENARAAGSRGGISSLLDICRNGTPGSQGTAAGVLRNLSVFPEIKANFMEENAVAVLQGLAAAGTAMARENAIGCLCNLVSGDVNMKLLIAREGAVEWLKTFWDGAPEVQTLEVAVELVRSLASSSSPAVAELLTSAGFAPRLVAVLDCGDPSIRIAAANAIYELGFNAQARKEMGDHGCVPLLTAMLEGKAVEEREAAAKALSSILPCAGNRRVFRADEGGIFRVIQLLDPSQNLDKKYPVSVLASVAQSRGFRKKMVAAGACPRLQKLADANVDGAGRLLQSLGHGRKKKIWDVFGRT